MLAIYSLLPGILLPLLVELDLSLSQDNGKKNNGQEGLPFVNMSKPSARKTTTKASEESIELSEHLKMEYDSGNEEDGKGNVGSSRPGPAAGTSSNISMLAIETEPIVESTVKDHFTLPISSNIVR